MLGIVRLNDEMRSAKICVLTEKLVLRACEESERGGYRKRLVDINPAILLLVYAEYFNVAQTATVNTDFVDDTIIKISM